MANGPYGLHGSLALQLVVLDSNADIVTVQTHCRHPMEIIVLAITWVTAYVRRSRVGVYSFQFNLKYTRTRHSLINVPKCRLIIHIFVGTRYGYFDKL